MDSDDERGAQARLAEFLEVTGHGDEAAVWLDGWQVGGGIYDGKVEWDIYALVAGERVGLTPVMGSPTYEEEEQKTGSALLEFLVHAVAWDMVDRGWR